MLTCRASAVIRPSDPGGAREQPRVGPACLHELGSRRRGVWAGAQVLENKEQYRAARPTGEGAAVPRLVRRALRDFAGLDHVDDEIENNGSRNR